MGMILELIDGDGDLLQDLPTSEMPTCLQAKQSHPASALKCKTIMDG